MKKRIHLVALLLLSGAVLCTPVQAFAAKASAPTQCAGSTAVRAQKIAMPDSTAAVSGQTQTCGGYEITFIGRMSGSDFKKTVPVSIREDGIYAVLSVARKDGKPMPGISSPGYHGDGLFASYYVKGLDPARYNIDTMCGSCGSCVKDGIEYWFIDIGGMEVFSGQGLFVGISDSVDGCFQPKAYKYDKNTGKISRRKSWQGVNALFAFPADQSKADPEAAQELLEKVNRPDMAAGLPVWNGVRL